MDISDGFDGYDFFYVRNQQGDITMIVDNEGTVNAQYQYDAYGKLTVVFDVTEGLLSMRNPYYYRGNRYDWEIERYYLNSRYYDPAIGRFISSDGMLGEVGDPLSTNMYAYCANNPVMYSDISEYHRESYDYVNIVVSNSRSTYQKTNGLSLSSANSVFIGIFNPKNQDERNMAISLLVGMMAANLVVKWYTAAGGLTYYGISTAASIAVGVGIGIVVIVFVDVLVYIILDAVNDVQQYED